MSAKAIGRARPAFARPASVKVLMTVALLSATIKGTQLGAQEGALARRIAAAPAGDVRLDYATREEACGDGRGMVGLGRMFHGTSVEGFGRWNSNGGCRAGDAHVVIVRRDGEVVDVRTSIGGRASGDMGGTSLGRVSASEAADFFLGLAERTEGRAARSALWAAALADSAQTARRFLAFAMNDARPWTARRTAMQLAGATGDASIVPELERIARSGAGDDSIERKKDEGNVARSAADALASVPQDAGMDALVRLATDAPSPGVRKAAVFFAAQSGDPRGTRIARTIAEDDRADGELRNSAIFALLNRDDVSEADRTWARNIFPRLTSRRLQDPILMGLAQHGTADDLRWVIGLASNEQLPVETRRQAIFWAGQGGATVADLLAAYRTMSDRRVKEHAIFALSQKGGEEATDALVDIVRKDPDRDMRRKAMFWLGQRKDAKAAAVLTEIINQP